MNGKFCNEIPESNNERLIIPLMTFNSGYDISNIRLNDIDNRLTMEDIHRVLDDIYEGTNYLEPFRKLKTRYCLIFVSFIIALALGIYIEYQAYNDTDNTFDNGLYTTGIIIIICDSLISPILLLGAAVVANFQIPRLSNIIGNILDMNNKKFVELGIRWVVSSDCEWLELWLDYRNRRNLMKSLKEYDENNDKITPLCTTETSLVQQVMIYEIGLILYFIFPKNIQ